MVFEFFKKKIPLKPVKLIPFRTSSRIDRTKMRRIGRSFSADD